MAKVTLERIECDVCREEGERYTLAFPEGTKILDRCPKHDKEIKALRDEPGDWIVHSPTTRGKLRVMTPEEIAQQRR